MGSNQMVRIAVSSLVVEPLVGVLEDDRDYEISGETKPCDRNELDACSPDLQLGAVIDGGVRLEAPYVVEVEAFSEELLVENARRNDFAGDLFSVVAPRVEVQAGI